MIGDIPRTVFTNVKGDPVLPDERFSSASEVRALCATMIQADARRAAMRSRVDGLVNGFPTYPKSVSAAKGMSFVPRVNFLESEGLIAVQTTPLYDLLTEVDHCMEIDLDIEAESSDQRGDWQRGISEAFTWLMLNKWRRSFNFHLPLSQREMLVHGLGAHVWPTPRGVSKWVPRTPRSGQILFPEDASIDIDDSLEYFLLRDWVSGVNVYNFIRNEQSAQALGWIPKNVWSTLAKATRQHQATNQVDGRVEELQRRYRSGDIGYWSTSQVGLWFNWLFVKEYEGGISLYLVEENIQAGTTGGGYLFKKRFQFDTWPLTLFPYDIGDSGIHSIRGLGWRTKDYFELSNRITNAMAAQVLIGAFPMLSQTQPNVDPDKMKLMRGGAMNTVPYGLKFEQIQFPQLSNTGLALSKHLRETLESNNQSMTGSSPEPKDRETKYSFQIRSHDSARVSNGMQSLYESNLQQFYEKIYRLLIKTPKGDQPYQKMAEEFRKRCRKKGIPDAALKENAIGEIRQVTSTGSGSAAIRLQAIQILMQSPVYMNAPESKKITIERDLVAWTTGSNTVDRYARSTEDAQLADVDTSFATQESNGLALGGDAVIGDGQNDLTHAQNHLAKAQELMDACEQGQEDPQKCLVGLQALLQHAGQHLAKLQQNQSRQAEFKQLADQWREIARYASQLQSQIQDQQNQPQPEQQLSEKGMIDMKKADQDGQIKEFKAQQNEQRAWRKLAFNERVTGVKTGSQIQLANAKTTSQMRMDRMKTAHQMQLAKIASSAKVKANGAAK